MTNKSARAPKALAPAGAAAQGSKATTTIATAQKEASKTKTAAFPFRYKPPITAPGTGTRGPRLGRRRNKVGENTAGPSSAGGASTASVAGVSSGAGVEQKKSTGGEAATDREEKTLNAAGTTTKTSSASSAAKMKAGKEEAKPAGEKKTIRFEEPPAVAGVTEVEKAARLTQKRKEATIDQDSGMKPAAPAPRKLHDLLAKTKAVDNAAKENSLKAKPPKAKPVPVSLEIEEEEVSGPREEKFLWDEHIVDDDELEDQELRHDHTPADRRAPSKQQDAAAEVDATPQMIDHDNLTPRTRQRESFLEHFSVMFHFSKPGNTETGSSRQESLKERRNREIELEDLLEAQHFLMHECDKMSDFLLLNLLQLNLSISQLAELWKAVQFWESFHVDEVIRGLVLLVLAEMLGGGTSGSAAATSTAGNKVLQNSLDLHNSKSLTVVKDFDDIFMKAGEKRKQVVFDMVGHFQRVVADDHHLKLEGLEAEHGNHDEVLEFETENADAASQQHHLALVQKDHDKMEFLTGGATGKGLKTSGGKRNNSPPSHTVAAGQQEVFTAPSNFYLSGQSLWFGSRAGIFPKHLQKMLMEARGAELSAQKQRIKALSAEDDPAVAIERERRRNQTRSQNALVPVYRHEEDEEGALASMMAASPHHNLQVMSLQPTSPHLYQPTTTSPSLYVPRNLTTGTEILAALADSEKKWRRYERQKPHLFDVDDDFTSNKALEAERQEEVDNAETDAWLRQLENTPPAIDDVARELQNSNSPPGRFRNRTRPQKSGHHQHKSHSGHHHSHESHHHRPLQEHGHHHHRHHDQIKEQHSETHHGSTSHTDHHEHTGPDSSGATPPAGVPSHSEEKKLDKALEFLDRKDLSLRALFSQKWRKLEILKHKADTARLSPGLQFEISPDRHIRGSLNPNAVEVITAPRKHIVAPHLKPMGLGGKSGRADEGDAGEIKNHYAHAKREVLGRNAALMAEVSNMRKAERDRKGASGASAESNEVQPGRKVKKDVVARSGNEKNSAEHSAPLPHRGEHHENKQTEKEAASKGMMKEPNHQKAEKPKGDNEDHELRAHPLYRRYKEAADRGNAKLAAAYLKRVEKDVELSRKK
ncbi:unnamed protein product [Amoebophrya sp. A120]|nr:unnamed protein product [Amoebophrya sp. A120]|eukprot:GSA120T00010451001.1